MAKIKVSVFKKSGKYYTEETYNLENYPSLYNVDENTTVDELRELQIHESMRIWDEIKKENMRCYCPVNDWKGFIFVFDGIFETNESGFLTYLWDRTDESN